MLTQKPSQKSKKPSKKSQETTKKLHRLISILRMLDNRKFCTAQTLSQQFATTDRNIYRDLNSLNAAGFAITFDKEGGTYRFTDPDFTLRDLNLNKEELSVLLVGKQVLQSLGKPFDKSYQSLFKKVYKDTGIKTQESVKRIEERQNFFIDIAPVECFEQIESQYNTIVDAMNLKEELEIVYTAMKNKKETRRCIAPYGLFFHEGLWYVIGYCNLRKEIRTFALDCIKGFRITGKPYEIPDSFDMADYVKPGWHIIRYGEPVEVVIRFTQRYARWIRRRKWHPTQVIEEQEDGSLILRATIQGTRELKWWTYHWIPDCEILAPPELRDEVIGEMKAMLKVYDTEQMESSHSIRQTD